MAWVWSTRSNFSTFGSRFSPSTMWDPRIELELSRLVTSTISWQAVWPALKTYLLLPYELGRSSEDQGHSKEYIAPDLKPSCLPFSTEQEQRIVEQGWEPGQVCSQLWNSPRKGKSQYLNIKNNLPREHRKHPRSYHSPLPLKRRITKEKSEHSSRQSVGFQCEFLTWEM